MEASWEWPLNPTVFFLSVSFARVRLTQRTFVPLINEQNILSNKDNLRCSHWVRSTILVDLSIQFIQTAYLTTLFQRVYWLCTGYFFGVPIDLPPPYIFKDTIRFKVQSSRDLSGLQGISPEDAYNSCNRIQELKSPRPLQCISSAG